MEMMCARPFWKRNLHLLGCLLLLCLMVTLEAAGQQKYTVRNGKMLIELGKSLTPVELDSFIHKFKLSDLGLKGLYLKQSTDSLRKQGWRVELDHPDIYVLTKPMGGFDNITDALERIIITDPSNSTKAQFPAVSYGQRYGGNRFRNKSSFVVKNNLVYFFLRNQQKAQKVLLAGSFSNWQQEALPMTRTDSGWVVPVKLSPGKYWYKFIIDDRWALDEDNQLRENDGRGNTNSVFYRTNSIFRLNGFLNVKRVFLAGSFNDWRERELLMVKTPKGWELPLYLPEGTHTYKFIADGQWHSDLNNPNRYPDEFGGYNSVLRLGKPHTFLLPGYPDAERVVLAGSFNKWREDELFLSKTARGWEINYTLGPGNYSYKFIVDRRWVPDPAQAKNGEPAENSYLIIEPNYTFRLKGHSKAKDVFLSGDFNNWSPNGFRMKREGTDWVFRVHLPPGKTRYKFVVDGNWIVDPENKLWEQNEYHTGNSVLWVEAF
ncbi:glycogen-binding domain-containing protein [Rufibacter immobilis]|uniref:glycogen-binding domain-containing protein n=1 Tax=Rufibacter immobilis TaxID=1348778 RepID=UPI0035E596F6